MDDVFEGIVTYSEVMLCGDLNSQMRLEILVDGEKHIAMFPFASFRVNVGERVRFKEGCLIVILNNEGGVIFV